MNEYDQYLRHPSGSVAYIGSPGIGGEVAERCSGTAARFSRHRKMKGNRDGGSRNGKEVVVGAADLRDSAGKESAGVGDKLDIEGEAESRK